MENKNQPAYPITGSCDDDRPDIIVPLNNGLTKRELIAAMAMAAILGNEDLRRALLKDRQHDNTNADDCVSVYAKKQADELLKQLEQ